MKGGGYIRISGYIVELGTGSLERGAWRVDFGAWSMESEKYSLKFHSCKS